MRLVGFLLSRTVKAVIKRQVGNIKTRPNGKLQTMGTLMRKKIISTLILTSASVLALSACGSDDGPPKTAAPVADVLAKMNLTDAEASPFNWTSVNKGDGSVTFEGWGDDGGTFTADKVVFSGLHLLEDTPSFDKVEISGLDVDIEGNNMLGNLSTEVGSVVLSGPNQVASAAFFKQIAAGNGFDAMSGYGFKSGSFTDMTMILDGDVEYGSLDSMTFEPGSGDKINITLINQELDMSQMDTCGSGASPEMDMIMTWGSNKTTNADPEYLKAMAAMMTGASNPTQNMFANMNYEENVVEGLEVLGDGFAVSMPKIETVATKRGDVMTTKSTISPSVMKLDALAMVGLGEMPFDGTMDMEMNVSADSMSLNSMNLDFKEQFMIDMAMDMNGVIGMMEGMAEIDQCDPAAMDAFMEANVMDVDYMKFKFTDNSIMDLLWTTAGSMQGISGEQAQQMALASLPMASAMAENDQQRELIGKMIPALSKFVEKGGALTFEMQPAEGFSFDQLATMEDPNAIMSSLGLSLSHSD